MTARARKPKATETYKLDLGCGKNKKEGFLGVDAISFDGVDFVADLRKKWVWGEDTVEEVHCSHFLEHLTGSERVHFYNELYRVMKKDAKATIVVPHWSSGRAYGDPTHQWPPVVEFSFYYLDRAWRDVNAPHCGLNCDFNAVWGYSIHPSWQTRSQDTQMFGLSHYREVAQDIICTLTKR
jgi:hypothetical protein